MFATLVLLVVIITVSMCHEGYDSSNVQFHPTGRILLTEYAKEVVSRGGPIAAVKVEDGILLVAARQKLRSKLQLSGNRKVLFIDKHIGLAACGSLQSLEPVVRLARKISHEYRSAFDAPIPVEKLCDSLAATLHSTTIAADARRPVPLGLIVAGVDETFGCQLYSVDPEGSVHGWNAIAMGKLSDDVTKSLADLSNGGNIGKSGSIKTVWPLFKNRILSIIKKQDSDNNKKQSKTIEAELNEDQKEFRSEYIKHHSEAASEDSSEWDLEGYVCLKNHKEHSSTWFEIEPSEWERQ